MKKTMMIAVISLVLSGVLPVMAAGDASAGKAKSAVCAACHGTDGNSPSDAFPKLAGQGEAYLVKQLADFKSGDRNSAIMAPMVAALSDQDMADLAAYFSQKTIAAGAVREEQVLAGEKIYRAGNKASGVPACMACHGPTGAGMPAAKWPALSAQYPAYVKLQLDMFADGRRANDPNGMMRDIAARLTEEEKNAVSAYVSGLH